MFADMLSERLESTFALLFLCLACAPLPEPELATRLDETSPAVTARGVEATPTRAESLAVRAAPSAVRVTPSRSEGRTEPGSAVEPQVNRWVASFVSLTQQAVALGAAGQQRVAVVTATTPRRLVVFGLQAAASSGVGVVLADVALPETVLPTQPVSLFMGRDDWPRLLIGAAPSAPRAAAYVRYRPGQGWTSPADEQGALARPGRALGLYGVLGFADPELLCAPETFCYEKRISGWKQRAVPGPGFWVVQLVGNPPVAWAWNAFATELYRLNEQWAPVLPTPPYVPTQLAQTERGIFAATAGGLYAIDAVPGQAVLGGPVLSAWSRVGASRPINDMAPVSEQRLLVLVDSALHVFDGSTLYPVAAAPAAQLVRLTATPEPRVFLAGDAGLFELDALRPLGP